MKKWEILSKKRVFSSIDGIIDELLKHRNIKKNERDKFLNPQIDNITVSSVDIDEKQVKKFLKRVKKAIENDEKIIIFGDYDVDGICGTAILWETIYSVSKNVYPYLPERVEEGYGLSKKGLDNVLKLYPDTRVIITVDNGIAAAKEVELAKNKGIDVLITDHHLKGKKLPVANAIVHTTKLCGAGVAWILSRELGLESANKINQRLELAALATIADLVPLNEWNRAIIKSGLKILKKTRRPGLQALIKEAGIDPQKVGVYEVGHIIAPRLNASGRMAHAIDSLRLICTTDPKRADRHAFELGSINKERQRVTAIGAEHAKALVQEEEYKVIVVAHESYNQGVIGLIASRLVEKYYRPSIAISIGEKISKGSARSISGVNIVELIRSVAHTLVEVGGHPMAAGFSIETAKIKIFQDEIQKRAEKDIDDGLFTRLVKIDLPLTLDQVSLELYNEILKLSPFGIGNSAPVFISSSVSVEGIRLLGKDNSHLKLSLSQNGSILDAIGFGMGKDKKIQKGDKIDIVYTIDLNEWNGSKNLQLKLKDVRKVNDKI